MMCHCAVQGKNWCCIKRVVDVKMMKKEILEILLYHEFGPVGGINIKDRTEIQVFPRKTLRGTMYARTISKR